MVVVEVGILIILTSKGMLALNVSLLGMNLLKGCGNGL